jgi:hypothetical protein
MREPGSARSWVAYWTPDPVSSFGSAHREFFHLQGDADGQPTRWDDPQVVTEAKKTGWRDQTSAQRRR